jgi:hypothetical protein
MVVLIIDQDCITILKSEREPTRLHLMKHLPSASCWANQSNLLQRFGERSANHSLQSSRLPTWNFKLPKKHAHSLAEQCLAPYRGYAKGENSILTSGNFDCGRGRNPPALPA